MTLTSTGGKQHAVQQAYLGISHEHLEHMFVAAFSEIHVGPVGDLRDGSLQHMKKVCVYGRVRERAGETSVRVASTR